MHGPFLAVSVDSEDGLKGGHAPVDNRAAEKDIEGRGGRWWSCLGVCCGVPAGVEKDAVVCADQVDAQGPGLGRDQEDFRMLGSRGRGRVMTGPEEGRSKSQIRREEARLVPLVVKSGDQLPADS